MAKRSAWIVVSFFFCLSITRLLAGADDRTPKDRMLAEYPAALKRLEAQYARISGKASYSSIPKEKGKKSTTEVQFAGDSGLSMTIEVDRGKADNGDGEEVRCSNLSYSFRLSRTSPDRPYRIEDVADGVGRVEEFGRFYFDGFLAAPCIAFGRPVREIMERPDLSFKLGDVSEVTDEGRRLIRIAFEFRLAPNFPIMPAWIDVDPEFGWAVRRYEVRFGPKRDRTRTGLVEYSGMEQGRPVIRRVFHSGPMADETMDISEIVFDRPLASRDFTLSAFGLPEVNNKPVPSGGIPLNYWLFGLGAVALGLSIFLRLNYRKRSASSPARAV